VVKELMKPTKDNEKDWLLPSGGHGRASSFVNI
jgi:hypothetical protein